MNPEMFMVNICRAEKSVINVALRIISFSTSVGSTMEEGDMESGGKTDESIRMRKRDEDVGGEKKPRERSV